MTDKQIAMRETLLSAYHQRQEVRAQLRDGTSHEGALQEFRDCYSTVGLFAGQTVEVRFEGEPSSINVRMMDSVELLR